MPFLDVEINWAGITALKSPKLLKTHLRPHFFQTQILDNRVKAVVVMRNPKDVLVSFYHFYKSYHMFGPFPGTWNEFFELAKNKQLIYGDWFDHILAWWAFRSRPNVFFLKYEDLKMHPRENVAKLAQFMNRDLTEDELTKIVEATSFNTMKKNPSVNYLKTEDKRNNFIRKGAIGGWKNYFTVAQNEYFDDRYEIKMKGSGLEFTFESNE